MRTRSRKTWLSAAVLGALAIIGAAMGLRLAVAADESDKGIVASLVSKALSSETSSVSIGAVEGALSSDVTIRDIVVADAAGPWLKLDKAHLVWSRLALLKRRLEVDDLEIGRLELLRRPLAGKKPKADQGPILPELPLKVIVKAFHADRIALGEPLVGVAAELAASGKATLGPPSEGLDLSLSARRLDAPGSFDVQLGYVPQTSKLTLSAKFDEPAGGLVARIAKLPGAPPVKLTLDGDGPLDAFAAKLQFVAGADIGADGELHLARQGAGRRLTAALRARVAGLLPPIASDVFAGETTLDASFGLADDGAVAIDALRLESRTAKLEVSGGVDGRRKASIKLNATSLPGAASVGSFVVDADGKGPLDQLTLAITAEIRDARFDVGRLAGLDMAFHATPSGPFGDPGTRIALHGEAHANGLALNDAALNDAFGPTVAFQFSGAATADGDISDAKVALTTERIHADFLGDASAKRVAGKAKIAAPDLSHFAGLAGRPLKGALEANFIVDASPQQDTAAATIEARTHNLSTGIAAVDGFAGGRLELLGGVKRLAGDGFGFDRLRLEGAQGVASLDGLVNSDKAAVHAEIDLPEAGALDNRIAGRAHLDADLSGALAHLDAGVRATLQDGKLLGRSAPRLVAVADLSDLTGQIHGEATLDGVVDAHPASGKFRFAKHADGGGAVDALQLTIGSARIEGNLALAPDHTAEGHVSLQAAKLDDLSPLLLIKLSGSIDARAELSAALGKQDAAIKAKSAALTVGNLQISGLEADLRANDVFGAAVIAGYADVAKAMVAGETVSAVKLRATAGAEASDLDLRFDARGIGVQARGRLAAGARSFTLSTFAAVGGGQSLRLLKPDVIAWDQPQVDLGELALSVGTGRLIVAGRVGSTLDLKLGASSLPLSAFDLVKPGLGLSGKLDADAKIQGAPSALEGTWRATVFGLSAPQTRSEGLPAISAKASGALSAGRTTVDATVDLGRQSALRLAGSAPLSADGALDLRATGKLDLALANSILAVSGERASGVADIDLRLQGVAAKPRALGSILVRGGAFSDETSGFKAEKIEAALTASGDTLDIARFSAATPNGGSLAASGRVRLDADAGFPGALQLTGKRAQLLSNNIVAMTADLSLNANGPLARTPKLTGAVDISSMDIVIPGRLPSQATPLADAAHIDPNATARTRLAMAAAAKARRATAPPFVASLELRVSAPSRIFVRGRGVDAELSGDLKVAGTTANPSTNGAFQLRRGTLSILGKTLDFTRGSATFHGDVIPDLDMLAETTTSDITAKIAVTGSAAKPTFSFSSQPMLAQDEILSRILFDKASGSLSPIQALQLANTASSFSGGPDAFEKIRKSLGVDSFDIGSDSSGGATVGVRRGINNRLSVGVTTGAKPEDNGVSLDFDVTKHLRLQGGANAAGGSDVGAGLNWEY